MTKIFKCFHSREYNNFSYVEKLRPSSCPAFWHVRVVASEDTSKLGKVLHVAEDMIENYAPNENTTTSL